jgi:hypothetical protein
MSQGISTSHIQGVAVISPYLIGLPMMVDAIDHQCIISELETAKLFMQKKKENLGSYPHVPV